MTHKYLLPAVIILLFLTIFIARSVDTMISRPFYEFDEAHRAENAKRMLEYGSFVVPLTGSSFDRIEHLKIPLKTNPDLNLYYHLERPPLVYDLMIISSLFLGNNEFAYRLPSFLLGLGSIVALIYFAKKIRPNYHPASLITAALALIASGDLWLSSQYAQLDTGITLFLFLGILCLVKFCIDKTSKFLFLGGLSFGLAILCKGQPAVILGAPLLFLILYKKLSIQELSKFLAGAMLVVFPWLGYLVLRFGVLDVLTIFSGFALSSASILYEQHKAPFFWYIRWWWETFRPGLTIFVGFVIYDLFHQKLTFIKSLLLIYVFGGLIMFSIPDNKIWWYVLPLIPAIALYLFVTIDDYLHQHTNDKIINLSLAIIASSLPIFYRESNVSVLLYGFIISAVCAMLLNSLFKFGSKLSDQKTLIFFSLAVLFSLSMFNLQFPHIDAYHVNTKEVATYYKNLPDPKCLWVGDMPVESALFYSEAGVILSYPNALEQTVFGKCQNNYLMSPVEFQDKQLLIEENNIWLYRLDNYSSEVRDY